MDPVPPSQFATITEPIVPPMVGFDLFTPLVSWLGSGNNLGEGISTTFSFLGSLWVLYTVIAYLATALFLYFFIYATIRKGQLEEMQAELIKKAEEMYDEQYRTLPKNDRLNDVGQHISSDNPNDWKLAIIEADIILDDALRQAGFGGGSLGERLRSISPTQLMSLNDAWQAHKVRNQIAHDADFILTKRIAEDTIKQYRRVFEELGIR